MRKINNLEVDEFTFAYIVAALWSTNDNSDPETGGNPLDDNYTPEDIGVETLKGMIEDCHKFQTDNAELLAKAYPEARLSGDGTGPESHAGHDFWLTRCGHGCGFWDGDWGEYGDALTEAAQKFGEVNLDVSDGLIYSN